MKSFKKYALVLLSFVAGALGFTEVAFAALPAGAATAFTSLETDVLDLVDLAWPVVISITVAFILLRMFKRAANSAT